MRTELPSGTAAELVHPPTGPSSRGLVVIPDVMGMRPLFDDLVARLATGQGWSVAAFELYPGREGLDVAERLAAASSLQDDRVLGDAVAAADLTGMIRVPEQWRGAGQGEPLDAMAAGDAASVLAVIGTDDAWTPPEHVEELEATGATVLRYVGADHGFVHDASRPAHRADDAADAWRRVVDWLGV